MTNWPQLSAIHYIGIFLFMSEDVDSFTMFAYGIHRIYNTSSAVSFFFSCIWIGEGSGSDNWCRDNCFNDPSYCPSDLCQCIVAAI